MNRFFVQKNGKYFQVSEKEFPNSQPSAIRPPPTGLGDLVAGIAQPIARGIDKLAGTKLAECGGCKARQAALNRAFPGAKPS